MKINHVYKIDVLSIKDDCTSEVEVQLHQKSLPMVGLHFYLVISALRKFSW
jgi:hypothetical protein